MMKEKIRISYIYILIAFAFAAGLFLFAFFNTSSVKNYMESQTEGLSRDMTVSVSAITQNEDFKGYDDSVLLGAAGGKKREGVNIYLIDTNGDIITSLCYDDLEVSNIFDMGEKSLSSSVDFPTKDDFFIMEWSGTGDPFFITEKLYAVSCIEEGSVYLVIENDGSQFSESLRSQFVLMACFYGFFFIVISILLTNVVSRYRSNIIRDVQRDPLTKLFNRKAFVDELNSSYEIAYEKDASFFLLDIDYFKQINDSYGHMAGDEALRLVAKHLMALSEDENGFAGRWGGDEFVGVLYKDSDSTKSILETLCKNINEDISEQSSPMTVSIGFTNMTSSMTIEELYKNADKALYESKEHGRNTVSFYESKDAHTPDTWEEAAKEKIVASISSKKTKQKTYSRIIVDKFWENFLNSLIYAVRMMVPFVAGGGILIALAFLFDAASVDISSLDVSERSSFGSLTTIAASLKGLGSTVLGFMLPVFAGFFAMGIAGEEAFVSGFVGGYLVINSNSGFIGAMIAGFAAGFITRQFKLFMEGFSKHIRAVFSIIVYPVINLLLVSFLMSLVITPVSSYLGEIFSQLLDAAAAKSNILSYTLSSAMMAVDMGGIVNKAAYNYGVNAIETGNVRLMAAVMIGGMIPPAGVALSAMIFKNKFSPAERENSITTLFMGLSFITEGVLPYVISDPVRVIPACVAGSALGGFLSGIFDCALPAPHGGIFVIPVIEHGLFYIIAFAAGSLLTALLLGLIKKKKEDKSTS